MKAVYFFCEVVANDRCSHAIWDQVIKLYKPKESNIFFEGKPALQYTDARGNIFYFVRTPDVLSHKYSQYLKDMNKFKFCDFGGIVNWHEGAKAEDRLLTVHSNSDVATGNFSRANPLWNRNMLQAVEQTRQQMGLNDFKSVTEATHWSGVTYGESPTLVPEFSVPLVDIEIGSIPESWNNEVAHKVMAQSLTQVFDRQDKVIPIVYIGGEHFDKDLAEISRDSNFPFAFAHHLPNQWVKNYGEKPEVGMEYLEKCNNSIIGGISAIFMHEGVNGKVKSVVRDFTAKYNIPLYKHKDLRNPQELLKKLGETALRTIIDEAISREDIKEDTEKKTLAESTLTKENACKAREALSDQEMIFLLSKYFGTTDNIKLYSMVHQQEIDVLNKNLVECREVYANNKTKNTFIMPVDLDSHMAVAYVHFDSNTLEPRVAYLDPYWYRMQFDMDIDAMLRNAFSEVDQIIYSPVKLLTKKDDYQGAHWVLVMLQNLAQSNGLQILPSAGFKISSVIERHESILANRTESGHKPAVVFSTDHKELAPYVPASDPVGIHLTVTPGL